MDKLMPPTRSNLMGRVTWPGVPPPADESDLTWAELSEKMRQERAEHERLRKQDADVMRDLRLSEDVMMQLVDVRAQLFNNERRRLNEELYAVRAIRLSVDFTPLLTRHSQISDFARGVQSNPFRGRQ